jgi:predicted transcriptional regulator
VATSTTSRESTGVAIQTWLPHPVARQLKELAQAERRSMSSAIRNAVEDSLRHKADEGRSS